MTTCLINQDACAREPGNPVCPKCGIDDRVVYPGQGDLEVALSDATARYLQNHAKACEALEQITFEHAMELISEQPNDALNLLRKVAGNGDARAMQYLGNTYFNGWWEQGKDLSVAFDWFQMAANIGLPSAMLQLASMYNDGDGVAQDFSAVLPWLEKADAAGDAEAALYLAQWHAELYRLGFVAKKFRRPAQEMTLAGRTTALAKAGSHLAEAAQRLTRYAAPVDRVHVLRGVSTLLSFGPTALQDHSLAESLVNRCISEQWGEQALQSIDKDKTTGEAYARCNDAWLSHPRSVLLYLLEVEPTSPQRRQRAKQLLAEIQSLSDGREPAAFFANKAFFARHGGDAMGVDLTLAHRLALRAAELGHEACRLEVASEFLQGENTKQDIPRAIKLYEELAEGGNADAMSTLGFIFLKNELVPHRPAAARAWLIKASEAKQHQRDAERLIEYFLPVDPTRAHRLLVAVLDERSGADLYDHERKIFTIKLALMEFAGYGTVRDESAALQRLEQLMFLHTKSAAEQLELAERIVHDCTYATFSDGQRLRTNTLRDRWCKKVEELTAQASQEGSTKVEEKIPVVPDSPTVQFQTQLKEAKAGSSSAMLSLGLSYVQGSGTPIDFDLGQQWLTNYCNAPDAWEDWAPGDAAAKRQAGIASRYAEVSREIAYLFEIPNYLTLAAQWLARASEAGDYQASYQLAVMLAEGLGVAKDDAASLHAFSRGVAQEGCLGGTSVLLNKDGVLHRFRDNSEWSKCRAISARTAVLGLKTLAQHGNWEAQYQLGNIYSNGVPHGEKPLYGWFGEDVEDKENQKPDLHEAFFWYQKAAQTGYPEGMLACAQAYAAGAGTAQDPESAIKWASKAAEAGLASAQMWLGCTCLENALGLKYQDADRWFEPAFAFDTNLATEIGVQYSARVDQANALERAFAWWVRGAEAGRHKCMMHAAACLLRGTGTTKDERKADAWLEKMLGPSQGKDDQGWANHAVDLAQEFVKGVKFPVDEARGVAWLRKAAELEAEPMSCLWLGLAYATGCGVAINHASAERWWQQACRIQWARTEIAEALLHIYRVIWGQKEHYEEARQAFERGVGKAYGLDEVGLGWLQIRGGLAGTATGAWLEASREGLYWGYVVAAEGMLLAKGNFRDRKDYALSQYAWAQREISTMRQKGWFVAADEIDKLAARAAEIKNMKTPGLLSTLFGGTQK